MLGITSVDSPVGRLTIAAREHRVCLIHFGPDVDEVRRTLARWYPQEAVTSQADPAGAVSILKRYFDGDLSILDTVEVEMNGTPFQRRVWSTLRSIPPGTTTSYGRLAQSIRAPSAVRAVGAANGANPVAIIVPCHRVIGTDGRLTGYGGGLDRKQWLLRHEGVQTLLF